MTDIDQSIFKNFLDMTPEDILLKAKIALKNEIAGYILYYINFVENPSIPTLGIDDDGIIYFNPQFVTEQYNKHGIDRIKMYLEHETLHLFLLHHQRYQEIVGNNDLYTKIANIAQDLVINSYLVKKYTMPNWAIVPRHDEYEFRYIDMKGNPRTYIVKNVSKKSWEDIFYELTRLPIRKVAIAGKLIDKHDFKGRKAPKDQNISDWQKIAKEALETARLAGTDTSDFEELINCHDIRKLDWREFIHRAAVQICPVDYTFTRPGKAYYSTGIYLPGLQKEMIEVTFAIDSSGSVTTKDAALVKSYINGLLDDYPYLKGRCIVGDTRPKKIYDNLRTAEDFDEVFKKFKGRGGTEFVPILDKIAELWPDTKLVIYLTDGCNFDEREMIRGLNNQKWPFEIIWLVIPGGCTDTVEKYGRWILLNE